MNTAWLLQIILVIAAIGAAIWGAARYANARDARRAAAAATRPRPIGPPPAPRGSALRTLGTLVLAFGCAALLWACMAELAIDPANGLAANVHWATSRNNSMVWGFGLIVVGLLMRLSGGRPARQDPNAPNDITHVRCRACAEPVLREAVKCKHCGADLIPQRPR